MHKAKSKVKEILSPKYFFRSLKKMLDNYYFIVYLEANNHYFIVSRETNKREGKMKAICFDEMTYAGICTSDAHMGSPIWYRHEDGPVAHWPASRALPDHPKNGGEWRQYDWASRDSAKLEPWNDDVRAAIGRGRKVRVE